MSGKSKHGKGKHLHRSKKSKAKQRLGAMASPQPGATETAIPAVIVSAPPPPSEPSAPATPAKPRTVLYPHITTELRRIAILAGIILVILIVLAQVLS